MKTVDLRLVVIAIFLTVAVSAKAGMTVFANARGVVYKQPNGVIIAFPDVCKTPSSAEPVPIPYPNIAMSSDKTAPTKVKVATKQPATADGTLKAPVRVGMDQINPVLHSFEVKLGGQLHIRQYDGTAGSVTEVTYVDASGRQFKLQEPTMIELANGEYCAVCVAGGKVTAIYRLLAVTPDREATQTPLQNKQ